MAVLIRGPSGSGKSDLALRLIDRGALLISDDYTIVHPRGGELIASAPPRIAGMMEVRGVGILPFEAIAEAPVALLVDLAKAPERLPFKEARVLVAGVEVPVLALNALEASAPIKVEAALRQLDRHID